MRIAVLQFNLMRDGQVFPAGSVVDVPEEAMRDVPEGTETPDDAPEQL